MSKHTASRIPMMASPISLKGEAACVLADELGIDVYTVAATREGQRPITTAEARAFFAKGVEAGYGGAAWNSQVWLTTAYDVSAVVR